MKIIWSEDTIRQEIAKMDAKTGLDGAHLPIRFSNAKCTLGMYKPSNEGGSFTFSNYYFQNADWPVEEALDTIRHEYAHYMEYMIYGKGGHGRTWKLCCNIVGAIPQRCYDEHRAEYYQRKHKKEEEQICRFETYIKGKRIRHPSFGVGVIEEVAGENLNKNILVDFIAVGKKRLGLAWVDENCEKYE